MTLQALVREIARGLRGEVQEGALMSRWTSFRIGGEALLLRPRDGDDLLWLLELLKGKSIPWRPLGGGTNLLVSDEGVKDPVVELSSLSHISVEGEKIRAGAGVKMGEVMRICAEEGLSGLEPLAGLPGTVGGAVRGNAGGASFGIMEKVEEILVLDREGEWRRRGREELSYSYRSGPLEPGELLWEATFLLERKEPEEVKEGIHLHLQRRRETQPLELPSAGCVFRNPPGRGAGELIEEVGGKGLRRGDAMVSEKHANFIVNLGHATAQDVLGLTDLVRERVLRFTGVELQLEIEVWDG